MANDDDDQSTGPRVGGWLPPYHEQPGGPPPELEPDSPDRLVTTAPGDSGPGPHGNTGIRRRGVLILAGIATLLLLSAGGIAFAVHNQRQSPSVAAPWTYGPASGPPTFSDTQQNPGLSVSASPSAAVSGLPSARGARGTTVPTTRPAGAPATAGKPAGTTAPAADPLAPGRVIGLEPADLPGRRLRHFNAQAWVDPISAGSSALDRADSRWIVHAGLGDSTCVSFESDNYRGEYLRHFNSRLQRDPPDGSALFNSDATFCAEQAGSTTVVRFRSANYPFRYLNRQDTAMFLADAGVTGETFTIRPPL